MCILAPVTSLPRRWKRRYHIVIQNQIDYCTEANPFLADVAVVWEAMNPKQSNAMVFRPLRDSQGRLFKIVAPVLLHQNNVLITKLT